jgi:hypothetical protein
MSAAPVPTPVETAGFGEQMMGMLNIFIDPAGAIKAIKNKWSWLWPLLIFSGVTVVVQLMLVPTTMRILQTNPPGGMTVEQFESRMGMIQTMQKVGVFVTPVFLAAMLALAAAILLLACTVMGMNASFRDLFSLVSHCSLISMLQTIAGYFVIRMKGDEIQTIAEMRPSFGLGLLFHEGIGKPLLATLDYFSIFTIWNIIITSLALAYLTGSSKGKGFAAAAPSWLLGLLIFIGVSYLQN